MPIPTGDEAAQILQSRRQYLLSTSIDPNRSMLQPIDCSSKISSPSLDELAWGFYAGIVRASPYSTPEQTPKMESKFVNYYRLQLLRFAGSFDRDRGSNVHRPDSLALPVNTSICPPAFRSSWPT